MPSNDQQRAWCKNRAAGRTADLPESATREISAALQGLADVFALHLKTKNFH
jgi:hypothetical protein